MLPLYLQLSAAISLAGISCLAFLVGYIAKDMSRHSKGILGVSWFQLLYCVAVGTILGLGFLFSSTYHQNKAVYPDFSRSRGLELMGMYFSAVGFLAAVAAEHFCSAPGFEYSTLGMLDTDSDPHSTTFDGMYNDKNDKTLEYEYDDARNMTPTSNRAEQSRQQTYSRHSGSWQSPRLEMGHIYAANTDSPIIRSTQLDYGFADDALSAPQKGSTRSSPPSTSSPTSDDMQDDATGATGGIHKEHPYDRPGPGTHDGDLEGLQSYEKAEEGDKYQQQVGDVLVGDALERQHVRLHGLALVAATAASACVWGLSVGLHIQGGIDGTRQLAQLGAMLTGLFARSVAVAVSLGTVLVAAGVPQVLFLRCMVAVALSAALIMGLAATANDVLSDTDHSTDSSSSNSSSSSGGSGSMLLLGFADVAVTGLCGGVYLYISARRLLADALAGDSLSLAAPCKTSSAAAGTAGVARAGVGNEVGRFVLGDSLLQQRALRFSCVLVGFAVAQLTAPLLPP